MISPDDLYWKITNAKLIAFDTETTGLDWRQHVICGYVFTFAPGDTHYIPVRHQSNNVVFLEAYENIIRQLAKDCPHITWVMHNASFDLMFCTRNQIKFTGAIHDTSVLAPMVNEHERYYSLDNLAKVYNCETQKLVNIYEYMGERFNVKPTKDLMARFWELPGDDVNAVAYACADGDATWELYHKLLAEIERQELGGCWAVESALTPVLHRITARGMKINEYRLHGIKEIAEHQLDKAQQSLPPDLNTRSPLQMKALFESQGMTHWPITATGRPSFPALWLMKSELGQKIVAAREWRTLLNTFIDPMIETHLFNGRVHTNYAQLKNDENGTISGRLSSYNPNLQNLTSIERHPEQGALLRSIFVPDGDGTLYEADYSQCEVRLAAHVGRIQPWIIGYNASPPLDAHSVASQISGLPRPRAKVLNLAILLGAGKDKAIEMLGVDYASGEQILTTYHERFPEIKDLQRKVAYKFKERGYVKSVLGRRYRLMDERKAYMGLSRILQGGNADVTKTALVEADKIRGVTLLNTVHDSILFQPHHTDAVKLVIEAMTDYVNEKFQLRAPLTVEVKSGSNWGAMK